MALNFSISTPQGRCWYTAGETVSGTVSWTNKRSTVVSRISVWLEGLLETSVKPISGQETTFGTAKHVVGQFVYRHAIQPELTKLLQVLTRRQSLYPTANTPEQCRRTFAIGTHSFNFQLSFPGIGREEQFCQKCRTLLPPNFAFASDTLKASVSYQLRILIERQGFLRPNLVREQPIEYRPLLPFFCSPNQHGWETTGRTVIPLSYPDSKAGSSIRQPASIKSQVTLEVTLPGPKALRPGNPVSVSITFIVPAELRLSFSPTWIFGLSIRLKATTSATARTHLRAHVGYIDVCNVQAILPIEMDPGASRVTLPSALWQHCIYPAAIPTFRLCEAERTYQLEVIVTFACSKADGTLVRHLLSHRLMFE